MNQATNNQTQESKFTFAGLFDEPQVSRPRYSRQGQINYYLRECAKKGIKPENYEKLTDDELQAQIDYAKVSASLEQKKLIVSLINEINSFEGHTKMNMYTAKQLHDFTFDMARTQIESLIKVRNERRNRASISDNQMKMLFDMFFCPDVDFEGYGIIRWAELFEDDNITPRYTYKQDGTKQRATRQVTEMEFETQIREKLSPDVVNKFIGIHKEAFLEWKKTRLTVGQAKRIRQLEADLKNLYPPQSLGATINSQGELVEAFRTNDRMSMFNASNAYEALNDAQLRQFTFELADVYIKQLEEERDRKRLHNFTENMEIINTTDYEEFQYLKQIYQPILIEAKWNHRTRSGYIEYVEKENHTAESLRTAQSKNAWQVNEFTALNKLLFALENKTGLGYEEMHKVPQHDRTEKVSSNDYLFAYDIFFDKEATQSKEKRQHIKDYFAFILEQEYVTFNQLRTMCRECETAQDLMIEVMSDLVKDEQKAKLVFMGY